MCRFIDKMNLLEIKANLEGLRYYEGCQLDCWAVHYFTTSTLLFTYFMLPLLVQFSITMY